MYIALLVEKREDGEMAAADERKRSPGRQRALIVFEDESGSRCCPQCGPTGRGQDSSFGVGIQLEALLRGRCGG